MQREPDLQRLESGGPYDLLVVGGGAAGAATLRTAALAGWRVALCEQDDFAAGTSSRSSRLIHGGLRYLEHGHVRLVIEALRERSILLRTAPHIVEPLPISIPLYRHGQRSAWRVRAGLWLYDRLAGRARLGASGLLPPATVAGELAGLQGDQLLDVACLWDARARLPARLVIENLLDAERLGAVAVARLSLVGLERRGGRLQARLRDRLAGRAFEVGGGAVVNAAGPWVGTVDRRCGARSPARLQWSRGSHMLLAPFAGAPERALLIESPRDRRPIFILPWEGYLLVGTTEVPHAADPSEAAATSDEITYLSEAFAAAWPAAAGQVPYATYAGVRPLPIGTDPRAADRRHQVVAHQPPGLFSLVGGKLTTHRLAAEELVARVARFLGRQPGRADATARRLLPGAEEQRAAGESPERSTRSDPIDGAGGLRVEEIGSSLREEGAVTLDDILLRRTGAGHCPLLTRAGLERAAGVWARYAAGPPAGVAGGEGMSARPTGDDAQATAARAEVMRVIALFEERFGRTFGPAISLDTGGD